MKRFLLLFLLLFSLVSFSQQYFPAANSWQHITAAKAGFDSGKLYEAIRYAMANESKRPRNMKESQKLDFGKEPFSAPIGLFSDRGDPTGLIIHKGYIVAEWGEPSRVDMIHSVTKSFLSTVVGVAVDKRLIRSVYDTVFSYAPSFSYFPETGVAPVGIGTIYPFTSSHNRRLNWDVLLRQTSDWEGELWGKPEWADRPDKDSTTWKTRNRNEPGAVFEYNDVRVNALALAATAVWNKSLPEVLNEYIMTPIGASATWKWHGYHNSWINLNKVQVQVVSGGGHWGGGMFINAYDMARFGLLTLHKGNWNGIQLISRQWIEQSLTPTKARPTYGYMNYFLNTDNKYLPSAPSSAFVHVGNGANIIYVDPDNELIMVVRWIESRAIDEFIRKVLISKR